MDFVEINGDHFEIQSMQRMEIFSIRKKGLRISASVGAKTPAV